MPCHSIADELTDGPHRGGDDGQTAGHGLSNRLGQAVAAGGKNEDVGLAEEPDKLGRLRPQAVVNADRHASTGHYRISPRDHVQLHLAVHTLQRL